MLKKQCNYSTAERDMLVNIYSGHRRIATEVHRTRILRQRHCSLMTRSIHLLRRASPHCSRRSRPALPMHQCLSMAKDITSAGHGWTTCMHDVVLTRVSSTEVSKMTIEILHSIIITNHCMINIHLFMQKPVIY